jgi:rhamnogalacturonyl hydrolase YesR
MMAGMMRAHALTKDDRYLAFVKRWADHWRPKLGGILEGPSDDPKAAPHKIGYCGRWGPGFPLVMLHEATGDAAYDAMAGQVVDFFRAKGTRTADGGFGHWRDNRQLWVDTLYMTVPVLMHLGRVNSAFGMHEEALAQIAVYEKRLKDASSGLYYHLYDEPSGKNVGVFWCRGNGWVIMSHAEALANLDRGTPAFGRAAAAFTEHARALADRQDPASGLWHTVLDHPETYIETSGSAMILYGLARGRKLGVLDPGFDAVIRRGWLGLSQQVDTPGRVTGVSVGTGPSPHEEYVHLARHVYTWGTGAFLLAAEAVAKAPGMAFDPVSGAVHVRLAKPEWGPDEKISGSLQLRFNGKVVDPSRLQNPSWHFVLEPPPAPPELVEWKWKLISFVDFDSYDIDIRLEEEESLRKAAGSSTLRLPPGDYRLQVIVSSRTAPAPGAPPLDSVQSFAGDWIPFKVLPPPEGDRTLETIRRRLDGADVPPGARGLLAEYLAAHGHPPADLPGFSPRAPGGVTLDDHAAAPFLVRLAPGEALPIDCRGAQPHNLRAFHYNSTVLPGRHFNVHAWDRPGVHRAVCDAHGRTWGWAVVLP